MLNWTKDNYLVSTDDSLLQLDVIHQNPGIERYRRLLLATTSAPRLYEKLGFTTPDNPKLFWHINRPGIYQRRPE